VCFFFFYFFFVRQKKQKNEGVLARSSSTHAMDDGAVAGFKRARGAEAARAGANPPRRGSAPSDDEEHAAASGASSPHAAASDSDDEALDLVGAEEAVERQELEAAAATDEEPLNADLRMVRPRLGPRAKKRVFAMSVLGHCARAPSLAPPPHLPARSRARPRLLGSRAPLSACA
jgi:hypothetical protein